MPTTILDTHLHLYPCYTLSLAFECFLNNTASYGVEVSRVACLAERHDCNFFESIAQGHTRLEGFSLQGVLPGELRIRRTRDQMEMSLLPGRQIISRENIEILALGCTELIDDGQPALDVIYQINRLGHVPVLPWSPGKWFGERGKLILRLITEFQAGDLLIGDTPLRPYGWSLPRLMKHAQSLGFGIVAGSDPLPFSGEERWLGAYHSVIQTDKPYTADTLLHALKSATEPVQALSAGKRSNVFSLADRLRKNAVSKKQTPLSSR